MSQCFEKFVKSYLKQVDRGINLLLQMSDGVPPLEAWRLGYLDQSGELPGGFEYELHGIGCFIKFDHCEIDFDFGPNHRSDGFDLWRLKQYLSSVDSDFFDYSNDDELRADFELAVENEVIQKIKGSNLYSWN